jgi:hypothetical protein
MPAPGSDEWHQIEAIARWKFDGINGRVQTFSFGIASVALFGILALVFTQDDVQRALVWFWESWMRLLRTGSSGNGGALLPVIAVGIIILPAVIYFARTYAELRRLEAVGIICALAAGGSAQQYAGRSDAAQPTVDGHNDTNAAPAAPAVSGDGSSDVPAPSGNLCSDTAPEPNAPAVSASGSPDADLSAGVSTSSAALTPSDAPDDPSKPANPGS